MRIVSAVLLLATSALPGLAQLSSDQKVNDFKQLAALYTKQYGPYGWKRDVIGFDLMALGPWVDRVSNAKDDLEFYEICLQYVASLNDAHSSYSVPSSFFADANFRTDIYDGKVLIDGISRLDLPADLYPFEIGDEVVSVDGRPVQDLMSEFSKYGAAANPRSTARGAAENIAFRVQAVYPRAVETPDVSTFVIRRQSGDVESYDIAWTKSGRPLLTNGPVPTAKMSTRAAVKKALALAADRITAPDAPEPPISLESSMPITLTKSAYVARRTMDSLVRLQRNRLPKSKYIGVRGLASRTPVFTIPGFTRRMGRGVDDAFYSGTFTAAGHTIGYIRIPSFEPFDYSMLDLALMQFDTEIAYFNQHTDGLVVDIMRNPGGYGCFAEDLLTRLMPHGFIGMGFSIRPTLTWVNLFYDDLQMAKDNDAPEWQLNLLGSYLDAVESAFAAERGMTGKLPLCTPRFERDAAVDVDGANLAYTKPIILLTDEFTASAGDMFAALFQDAKRGPVVGWRTMGAGGNVAYTNVGMYSEGSASVTQSLMMRPAPVSTPDYPSTPFLENVGVRPDIEFDYMTADNLAQGGLPFVKAFTNVMVDQINAATPK